MARRVTLQGCAAKIKTEPPRGIREWPLAIAACTVVALLVSWPLAIHLTAAIPLGSEPIPTVPLFNLWTLGWNASWWSNPTDSYWDAPIFHPAKATFAFSDPQPLTGLIAAPLWSLNRAFAYNAVLLLFLVLGALGVFRLLRDRGLCFQTALTGGLLAQALPFLTHERGVLQLQAFFGVVWALVCLWKLADTGRYGWGIGLGLAVTATVLTSEYYALFLALLLPPAFVVLGRQLLRREALRSLLLGIGLALTLTLPVLVPQSRSLAAMGFRRGESTLQRYSATPADYLNRSPTLLSSHLWPTGSPPRGQSLSPGWMLVALGALGARQGLRNRGRRSWTVYVLASSTIAFGGSFGIGLSVAGWHPWTALGAVVPGLSRLRSPFRLALFVQLGLVFLAAEFLQHLHDRKRRKLTLALTVVVMAELLPLPGALIEIPGTVHTELDSPLVFIPFVQGSDASDYLPTVVVMNTLLPSRTVLVNGYSGFFPTHNAQLKDLLADFPAPDSLTALRALGVENVLVSTPLLRADQRERLAAAVSAGELVHRQPVAGLEAFGLVGSRLRMATEYSGPWHVAARVAENTVELTAVPQELRDDVYLVTSEVAPLKWRVRVNGSGKAQEVWEGTPPGSMLLYRGSRFWPTLRIPAPARGPLTVELTEVASGRTLGTAYVEAGRE